MPPAISGDRGFGASKGVFAFEASSATLPPAFETEPFDEVVLLEAVDRLVARGLLRALRPAAPIVPTVKTSRSGSRVLERLEELLPLLDLVELERLRLDRLLEDRVVWAMGIASLGFRASCAFRTGVSGRFTPHFAGLNQLVRKCTRCEVRSVQGPCSRPAESPMKFSVPISLPCFRLAALGSPRRNTTAN